MVYFINMDLVVRSLGFWGLVECLNNELPNSVLINGHNLQNTLGGVMIDLLEIRQSNLTIKSFSIGNILSIQRIDDKPNLLR